VSKKPACPAIPASGHRQRSENQPATLNARGFRGVHLLRKAHARTLEAICAAIGELLGSFTAAECANYFRNSGYAPT